MKHLYIGLFWTFCLLIILNIHNVSAVSSKSHRKIRKRNSQQFEKESIEINKENETNSDSYSFQENLFGIHNEDSKRISSKLKISHFSTKNRFKKRSSSKRKSGHYFYHYHGVPYQPLYVQPAYHPHHHDLMYNNLYHPSDTGHGYYSHHSYPLHYTHHWHNKKMRFMKKNVNNKTEISNNTLRFKSKEKSQKGYYYHPVGYTRPYYVTHSYITHHYHRPIPHYAYGRAMPYGLVVNHIHDHPFYHSVPVLYAHHDYYKKKLRFKRKSMKQKIIDKEIGSEVLPTPITPVKEELDDLQKTKHSRADNSEKLS